MRQRVTTLTAAALLLALAPAAHADDLTRDLAVGFRVHLLFPAAGTGDTSSDDANEVAPNHTAVPGVTGDLRLRLPFFQRRLSVVAELGWYPWWLHLPSAPYAALLWSW